MQGAGLQSALLRTLAFVVNVLFDSSLLLLLCQFYGDPMLASDISPIGNGRFNGF